MANLVTIDSSNMQNSLAQWRSTLNQFISSPKAITTPLNVAITAAEGSLTVSWAKVKGANGYEVWMSKDGSFLDAIVHSFTSGETTTFTDGGLGATPTTRFYKVLATTGSILTPFSIKSKLSVVVSATSKPFPTITQANVTITGPLSTNVAAPAAVDIAGLTVTLTTKQNPNGSAPVVLVIANLSPVAQTAGSAFSSGFSLLRVGLGTALQAAIMSWSGAAAAGPIAMQSGIVLSNLDTPGVGTFTYKVQWDVDAATTTVSIIAGQGANISAIQIV